MSLTTIYRVVVMIAVGAIIFKGWKMYGPTTEQVKATLVNVAEIAESNWKGQSAPSDKIGSIAADKGAVAPAFANTAQQSVISDSARPGAATLTQSIPSAPAGVVPTASIPASPALITPPPTEPAAGAPTTAPATAAKTDDRVPVLLSQLEKLGAAEAKLAPWGDSGHLYRFSCRAALADSPSLTRHFESVAEEPAAAVEQVVAKVEAWRVAQRTEASIRY